MTLKRTIELLKEYLKMNNIIELTDTTKPSSSERANKYRLDQINKIRDYFNNEIKERKDIIKKLNKYLVSFDYLDEIFSIIWYVKYSFICFSSRYTSRYYRCFFDFNIYNRYGYKEIVVKSYLKKEKRNIIK